MVGRLLDAAQTLGLSIAGGTSDTSALRSFVAGLNQEQARQFALAVASFQAALKTGSQIVEPEVIGRRLEAIEKNDPAAFEKGVQLSLNPPLPVESRPSGSFRAPSVGFPPGVLFPSTSNPAILDIPARPPPPSPVPPAK